MGIFNFLNMEKVLSILVISVLLFGCGNAKETNNTGLILKVLDTSNVIANEDSGYIHPIDEAKTITDTLVKSDSIEIQDLIGKFNYKTHSDFISIESKYCSKPIYLRKEVYSKFKEMYAFAQKDSCTLTIVSGTRNFYEQKAIWDRKWSINIASMDSIASAKKILLFSSMPSTSRHHWGTDIDLINLNNSYFESGQGLKEYTWLCENASKYGFCQVYDDKEVTKRTGYELEKWHWSYMPIAAKYLQKYNELVNYSVINGFAGSDLAEKMNSIELYVNGITKVCPE